MLRLFVLFALLIPASIVAGQASQEVVFDSSYYEKVDETYFIVKILRYADGAESTDRNPVGDSIQLSEYLAKKEYEEFFRRAQHQAHAARKLSLGEYGRLFATLTGKTYYSALSEQKQDVFVGEWTIKGGSGPTRTATVTINNGTFTFAIAGVGNFTMFPLSTRSFVLLNYYGQGDHLEVFLYDEKGDKRLFHDNYKTVRVIAQ